MVRKQTAEAVEVETTAIEKAEAQNLAELSDFFSEVGVTGLEGIDSSEIQIASKLWNMGGLDENGDQLKKNEFYDTITEERQRELRGVFLLRKKSNRWTTWDQEKEKTIVHCSSDDQITGTMADGKTRKCEGCPEAQWFRDEKGQPYKKCAVTHTVVGIESDNGAPFIMRFRKTSLKPWKKHLNRYHIGKGKNGSTFPLFAYECKVSLQMHEGGVYAFPIIEKERTLSKPEAMAMAENAKIYLEIQDQILSKADSVDESVAPEDEGVQVTFGADDFKDD